LLLKGIGPALFGEGCRGAADASVGKYRTCLRLIR